ncbi:MAG TPA: hypothetical protein V6C95_21270 [Coleofasciculaceae cyanobacterium]
MTGLTLKQYVLTPVILSAAVFSALTLPLAAFGSKPVTIQFQEEPVFSGQLRDVAMPYLGFATALSLGTGLASIAVTGWQQSTRKSSQVEEELSTLAQNLKEKEEQLQSLLFSESRLSASHLNAFIDEDLPLTSVQENVPTAATREEIVAVPAPEVRPAAPVPMVSVPQTPVVAPAPTMAQVSQQAQSAMEPLVITTQPIEAQPAMPSSVTAQTAAAKFASSQAFFGYAQAHTPAKASASTPLTPAEFEQLQLQLQQLMVQMVSIQAALEAAPHTGNNGTQASNPVNIRVVKNWSEHKIS